MPDRTILAVFANPRGTQKLALDEELRTLSERLDLSRERPFKLHPVWATRLLDLQHALNVTTPEIVHISAHGSKSGLFLASKHNTIQPIAPAALANLLGLHAPRLRAVILNACYSDVHEQDLRDFPVRYIVSMSSAIRDESAIAFTTAFYDSLCTGKKVEDAFKDARLYMIANADPDGDTPKLLINDNVPEATIATAASPLPLPTVDASTATLAKHATIPEVASTLSTGPINNSVNVPVNISVNVPVHTPTPTSTAPPIKRIQPLLLAVAILLTSVLAFIVRNPFRSSEPLRLHFQEVASSPDGALLRFTIRNSLANPIHLKGFRIEHTDPQLTDHIEFGELFVDNSNPVEPNQTGTVDVGIVRLILKQPVPTSADAAQVRIVADAIDVPTGALTPLSISLSYKEIKQFVDNRHSVPGGVLK